MNTIIDLYHQDGFPDWEKVAGAGITGAYLKASEGTTTWGSFVLQNADAMTKAGVKIGCYHWLRPEASIPAAAQVDAFHNVIQSVNIDPDLGVMLDIEPTLLGGSDLWLQRTPEGRASRIRAAIENLNDYGYASVVVYSPALWWNENAYDPNLDVTLSNVRCIAARYPFNDSREFSVDVFKDVAPVQMRGFAQTWGWQYSEKGQVDGFAGDCDMTVLLAGTGLLGN